MNDWCKDCCKVNNCPFSNNFKPDVKPVCYEEEWHNTISNNSKFAKGLAWHIWIKEQFNPYHYWDWKELKWKLKKRG